MFSAGLSWASLRWNLGFSEQEPVLASFDSIEKDVVYEV